MGLLTGIGLSVFGLWGPAQARLLQGDPGNYRSTASSLVAGDTLSLAAGRYVRLTLSGLQGSPDAWIVVRGPASGSPAVIEGEACCNTIQLYGCSFLAIENLTVDGKGLDVDGVNAKDTISHDIRVEDCTFVNLGASQSTVAISTKSTAWDWVIRGNRLLEPGTGLYLGNSDGTEPFINGVIEGNLVDRPTGYGMEIKFQLPYTLLPGMPPGPNRTIIRNNVFIKDDRPSPSGDRPNLLVDPFPPSGPGSRDQYEVYGNVLFYNSRESLLQASGRLSIHDNIFFGTGASQTAIYLTEHNGGIDFARVYGNTVYGGSRGIYVATAPAESVLIIGNLVFAGTPIGSCGGCAGIHTRDNVMDQASNAALYVNSPSPILGSADFYPRGDGAACRGAAIDPGPFTADADYALDFNGSAKGDFSYRGAYAGAGTNPGWFLAADRKIGGPSSGSGADTVPPTAPRDLRARADGGTR